MAQKTITINGRLYDAVTGLPVAGKATTKEEKQPKMTTAAKAPAAKTAPKKASISRSQTAASSAVHTHPLQRTQTLRGRVAKKPAAPQKVVTKRASPGRHMDISRSAAVAKFAPHPTKAPVAKAAASATKKPVADHPAHPHPTAQRALTKMAAKKHETHKKPRTAKEVKDAAINAALDTPKKATAKSTKKKVFSRKWPRRLIIIGTVAAIIIGALYIVYRFVPAVSVGIAASQSGVNASFPEYTPDGYSLSHPVTYTDGEVSLKFDSNSNDNFYTIVQTRSSWESSAVLDNVVLPKAANDYTTTKERGLTIYSYGNNAAWVNKGVLYKIEGNAALSGDQVRKIATSL